MITKEKAKKRAKLSQWVQDMIFRRSAIIKISFIIWFGSLLGKRGVEVIFDNNFWRMLTEESKSIVFAKIEQKGFEYETRDCLWEIKVKIHFEVDE